MNDRVFLAINSGNIARAEMQDGAWRTHTVYEGDATVLKKRGDTVYAGTRSDGILRSDDGGKTWASLGLKDQVVKSIAISKQDKNVIYAGTKPPALYVTHDGGTTWTEREALRDLRRWFWFTPAEPGDPYVMGLDVSPEDHDLLVAGIEFGGVFVSRDGGQSWDGHKWGSSRDCHYLTFHHHNGEYAYQAGGGWPGAITKDGGHNWKQPLRGLGWSIYGMACAADPQNPDVWYLSAAPMMILPEVNKMPRMHFDGDANAFIFRKRGTEPWKRLRGGLPHPLPHAAYALVTDTQIAGQVYAGLSNGDVWHSDDHGDNWRQLPFNLGGVHYSLVVV